MMKWNTKLINQLKSLKEHSLWDFLFALGRNKFMFLTVVQSLMFHLYVLVQWPFRAILFLAVLHRTLEMSLDFVGASSRPFRLYCILVTVQTGLQLFQVVAFLGCFFGGRLQRVEPDGFSDLQDFLGHLLDLCLSYGLLIF